ncbi:hypothetical protein CERSUDRAFT_68326 [Gelatoporia subvermispora B]|uniref:Heterokaryon incompatibility domain-containing protein n=1 Tax=Ceriporiopsis subvermispora (strain B) TaxID=914234 RepID=M2QLB1_CERS8|nr:hypothetical protein CERSUDRAFT_68326 [Gelatoporia subvermispora B]
MTSNVTQDEPLNFSEIRDARVALICKDAPWLGAKHDGYSPASFDNYKLRREPIAQLDLHRKRNSSFYAALQQSQYTFSLLETVLDKPISERYLLRRSLDGTKCISMQAVPYLLRECQSHVRNLWETNPDAYKQWSQRARHALEMTRQFISWESMEPDRTFSKVELDSQGVSCILFMISALTEALWNFLDGELQAAGVSDDLTVLGLPGDINASCHREMVENGWCPFATSQLHGYSTCALGFASTCEPFVRKGVGHRSHDQCTRDICVSNNIDPAVYTNLHVTEGCTCSFVVPPIERIKDALLRREIPIIRIHAVNTPDDADVKISCKTASSDTPYVAISHVWADGLGSTTERGLPMCQLRRLAEFAHSLVDGGFLWLDALCVPEEKELRKFAIGLMGQTYRQATKVFVIDSGIRSCSVNAPTEEKLLRVVTSGWMQRLWTLQEAVLASELIFQLADGLLTLGNLLKSGMDWTQPVAIQLCCAFGDVCMLMSTLSRPPSSLRLLGVVNALRGRSTSKLSDETLAISSLLGVDAYALANQDSLTERMKALLLQVKEIPSGLPFLVDGPRLTDRGFRWAPATFLRSGDASRIVGDGSALCTPNGLLARYYCFILRIPVALHKPYVILSKITLSGPDLVLYYADVNDPVEPASGVELCNAIILQTEPSFDNLAIAVSMEQDRIRSSDGVMRHRCAYIKALHLKHGILGVRSDIPLREPVDVEEGRFIDMCLT